MNKKYKVNRNYAWAMPIIFTLIISGFWILPKCSLASTAIASQNTVWELQMNSANMTGRSQRIPLQAKEYRLQEEGLTKILKETPPERSRLNNLPILPLPMPNESVMRFRIWESPVMDATLAAQYPEIKSYSGQGIDDPAWTVRFDWTPQGLHAFASDGAQTVQIHPIERGERERYVSYYGREYAASMREAACLVNDTKLVNRVLPNRSIHSSIGGVRRTYRIAVATTVEYSTDFGNNNLTQTLSSINTWLNAVNAIYNRELSIQLNLVASTTNAIYLSGTDPFTNGNLNAMVNEVRSVLRDQVDPSNYDIGHLLGTSPGSYQGTAYIGVACETASDSFGPYKGGGVTLVDPGAPIGNDEDTAMIAHEIGHQFGATHTHNAATGECGGSRNADTAWESGSGLTLMSQAGSCSPDWVAFTRDLRFHSGSYEQIVSYLNTVGICAATSMTGNSPPSVDGGEAIYVIPKNTPFALTATGSDPNGQAINYAWEQNDAGGSFLNPPYEDQIDDPPSQIGDPPSTTRPIFRPFSTSSSPTRIFPSLTYILNNANDPPAILGGLQTAEELPRVGRQMDFRVTARDGQGGVSNDSVRVIAEKDAGPFLVTAPNTNVSWAGGTTQTVSWIVNNTNVAPVNCASVKISLSTDGGNTFPTVLAAATANDGSEAVTIPSGLSTSLARIKVESVGNIFFDISDVNFTLTTGACTFTITPTGQSFSSNAGSNSISVTTTAGCAWTAVSNDAWITITSGSNGNGNGSVNYSVSTNTGTNRAGTILVAGKTFTVVQAGTVATTGLQYYPLPRPIRLFDSRAPIPGFAPCAYLNQIRVGGQEYTHQARVTCDGITIPSTAKFIVGSAAVTSPQADGFITLWPNGQTRPPVSSLNYVAGQTIPNSFTVGLDANGNFRAYSFSTTHMIVDVVGYFAPPATGGLYFHPLPRPIRLYDTRPSAPGFPACAFLNAPLQSQQSFSRSALITCDGITIPADAQVITGMATATQSTADGFITMWPTGEQIPPVSNVNYSAGQTVTNSFTVRLNSAGSFDVQAWTTTHLMVDVTGYYSSSVVDANGAGYFLMPLTAPIRLFDTRAPIPGFAACEYLNQSLVAGTEYNYLARVTCGSTTIPASAGAIIGNATVVTPSGAGYSLLWPNGQARPPVTNINYLTNQNVASAFVTGLSADGRFRLYNSVGTHFVVDISGYFAP